MARVLDDSAFLERAQYTSKTPVKSVPKTDAQKDAELGISRGRTDSAASVDERTQLQAKGVIPTPQEVEDAYYVRDPKTGLSPAQVDAQNALKEAMAARTAVGLGGTLLTPEGSAGKIETTTTSVTTKPSTSEITPPGGNNTQFVEYEYNKDFTKRRAKYFNPATGQFTYGEWEDAPMSKEEFDKQQATKIAEEKALNEKRDAFALIEATMRSYGFSETELKELIDYIQSGLLNPALGANQLVLQLRQLPSYKARFAGNEERRARGLNTLDESDYLRQENAYAETLRQYGLQRLGTRQQYATLMGNGISNIELGKRAALGVDRLQNADPAILNQLRKYYNITDSDVLAYLLNPKEMLPELEAKVTTAEIGATAEQFGLNADLKRISDLEKYGVNLQSARAGYSQIASRLPRATQLSEIYKQSGIAYNQLTGEEEEFKGLASAKRARERLAELETAAFSGAAGLGRTSLGRTTGGQI